MKSILEQHFWFDGSEFDKKDYPTEKLIHIDSIENQSSFFDEYNLFDFQYGSNRYIKLSELLEADTEPKWAVIKEKARHYNSITLVNDILFQNEELDFIKQFYISVFYSALKKENSDCYVYDTTNENKVFEFAERCTE